MTTTRQVDRDDLVRTPAPGVEIFWQTVVHGVVLIVAVAVDMALRESGPGRGRPAWLQPRLRQSG